MSSITHFAPHYVTPYTKVRKLVFIAIVYLVELSPHTLLSLTPAKEEHCDRPTMIASGLTPRSFHFEDKIYIYFFILSNPTIIIKLLRSI